MLSVLRSDLVKLEAALNTLNTAADAAEAIPQARGKVKKTKETLSATLANVTAARQRLDAIVNVTDPIQKNLAKAARAANGVEAGLYAVNDGAIAQMKFPISIAAGCYKKLPADKKDCAGKNIDKTADDVDPAVLEYDRVVRLLPASPEPWLPSMNFFDPFGAELNAIDSLRAEVESLTGRVNALARQFKGVAAVLEREFSFSFPYPDPTVTDPLRFSNKEVSLSFKEIIDKANSIEDKIESKLGGFLWGVLNDLGVGKFVNKLKNEAENAANSLTAMVDLNIDLKLPDMNALAPLEASLGRLSADVNGLKFPSIDTQLPGYGFPDVGRGISFGSIDASFRFFNPGGLKVDTPNVCDGATYGCN